MKTNIKNWKTTSLIVIMLLTAFSCSNRDLNEIENSNDNHIVNIFGVEAKIVNNTLSLENAESLNS